MYVNVFHEIHATFKNTHCISNYPQVASSGSVSCAVQ